MNIYVVRQATQGLANWVKTQGGTQTVAISYDSRLKSDVFAKTAAGVLAANGINVRIYDALMPVPALSFATRYYNCNAGVMVTASHNPAKYNGYKAYGPDGCQMTDDAAAIVYAEIQKTDVLTGAKYITLQTAVVADCHSLCAPLCLNPVRQSLCCLTYYINIHTIRSCSENSTKSCCSKLQSYSETIFYLFVISFNSR